MEPVIKSIRLRRTPFSKAGPIQRDHVDHRLLIRVRGFHCLYDLVYLLRPTGHFHFEFFCLAEGVFCAEIGVRPGQRPPEAGDGGVGQALVIGPDVPGVALGQGRLDGGEMAGGDEDL